MAAYREADGLAGEHVTLLRAHADAQARCSALLQEQAARIAAMQAQLIRARGATIRAATAKTRQIHVAVIGAGFAGLRCADVLIQHGCKVTILEARDRIGGRVAQSNYLGHLVDL